LSKTNGAGILTGWPIKKRKTKGNGTGQGTLSGTLTDTKKGGSPEARKKKNGPGKKGRVRKTNRVGKKTNLPDLG